MSTAPSNLKVPDVDTTRASNNSSPNRSLRSHSSVFASKLKFFSGLAESESHTTAVRSTDSVRSALSAGPSVRLTAPGAAARASRGGRGRHERSLSDCGGAAPTKSLSADVSLPKRGHRLRSRSANLRPTTTACVICKKAAYPTESITVDRITYHKRCFKCEHCKCRLTMGGFAMINTNAYCKPHFKQLFQESGGKYDRAFGSIWSNSSDPKARSNTVVRRKNSAPEVEADVVNSDSGSKHQKPDTEVDTNSQTKQK